MDIGNICDLNYFFIKLFTCIYIYCKNNCKHLFSVIAAGFTNGYIGLWHLTTVSPYLLTVRNNTKFINKFQHFFAHYNAITSK